MKKIIEIFPLLSAILILVGFYILYIYYKFFDIEIYNYLTTSELIISFLPVIVSTIFIVFVLIMTLIFLSSSSKRENDPENSFGGSIKFIFTKSNYKGGFFSVAFNVISNLMVVIYSVSAVCILIALSVAFCMKFYNGDDAVTLPYLGQM